MFEIPKGRSLKRRLALIGSFVLHCAVVFLWLHREPAFVKPSSVAWGRPGTSGVLIYLPPKPEFAKTDAPSKLHFKRESKPVPAPQPVESARGGTSTGSMFAGPATGIEATPALPLVFPDPAIFPWQLSGVQGDVVVEVTIDQQGVVSETKVLQSLKQEIDEKCIATLRNWRFRPAMVDGIAISSRQDVHFHFPS